jgi:hypothetical protein
MRGWYFNLSERFSMAWIDCYDAAIWRSWYRPANPDEHQNQKTLACLARRGATAADPGIRAAGSFWQGLLDWFRDSLCKSGTIDPSDLDLLQVRDEPKAVVDAIFDH